MKPKLRIVSANFGTNKSEQKVFPSLSSDELDVEYFVYDDTNSSSRKNSLHPRLKGKIPKMLDWMYNDADYYVWMDSYYTLQPNNFSELIKYVENHDICFSRHLHRNSIKSESDYILSKIYDNDHYLVSRYDGEPLDIQVRTYLRDESFIDNNLFSLGFFIYNKKLVANTENNLMLDWFFHNCYWSVQDQISLPYLLHKHKVNFNIFNFDSIYKNPFANYERF